MRIGRSALAAWNQKSLPEARVVSFENVGSSKIILYDVAAPANGNSHIRAHGGTGRHLDRRHLLDTGKDSQTDGRKTLKRAEGHSRLEKETALGDAKTNSEAYYFAGHRPTNRWTGVPTSRESVFLNINDTAKVE